MTILYLFYHKPLSSLKIQLKSLLVEEKISKDWSKTFGYYTIKLDGFRLNFKEEHHCLGISYGSGRIKNATGLSKEETFNKVSRIFDLLISKTDFSEHPCSDENCKKYLFAFSTNKTLQKAEKRKKQNSPLSQQTESERPTKKLDLVKNKIKNKKLSLPGLPPPPSAHLLDIKVDNSAEVEFMKKLNALLTENNSSTCS